MEQEMKGWYYKIYKADDENEKPWIFKLIKKIKVFENKVDPVKKRNDLFNPNRKNFHKITAVDSSKKESVSSEYHVSQ